MSDDKEKTILPGHVNDLQRIDEPKMYINPVYGMPHKEEEPDEYIMISGGLISESTKKKIEEFFSEKKHEHGEVLLIELPPGCRIRVVFGHILTKLDIVESGGK